MSFLKDIRTFHAVLLGLAISIGPGLGGFFIGKSIERFKASGKNVSVRGLSERIVDADKSSLTLIIKETLDDPSVFQKKHQNDKKEVLELLKASGIDISTIDENVRIDEVSNVLNNDGKKKPYRCELSIFIKDIKNDQFISFEKEFKKIKSLGRFIYISADVSHEFTKLEEIRAPMLAEATKSARAMAEQFAKDSGTSVGGITHAQQGTFSIRPASDKSDHDWGYDQKSSFKKRIRVVSNVTFQLN